MYIYICIYKYIYIYNVSTKRSCCLQFLAFLGAKEPLAVASFRCHLNCELFPRVAATALY